MLPNKVYDVLKYVCTIALPAIATLYATLGAIWGLPYVDEIPRTIMALDTCLGILLGISTAMYNKEQ